MKRNTFQPKHHASKHGGKGPMPGQHTFSADEEKAMRNAAPDQPRTMAPQSAAPPQSPVPGGTDDQEADFGGM